MAPKVTNALVRMFRVCAHLRREKTKENGAPRGFGLAPSMHLTRLRHSVADKLKKIYISLCFKEAPQHLSVCFKEFQFVEDRLTLQSPEKGVQMVKKTPIS